MSHFCSSAIWHIAVLQYVTILFIAYNTQEIHVYGNEYCLSGNGLYSHMVISLQGFVHCRPLTAANSLFVFTHLK